MRATSFNVHENAAKMSCDDYSRLGRTIGRRKDYILNE